MTGVLNWGNRDFREYVLDQLLLLPSDLHDWFSTDYGSVVPTCCQCEQLAFHTHDYL